VVVIAGYYPQHGYVQAFDAARRSEERRSKLDPLYGNGMETAGRSRQKQTEAPNREDAPDLRVVSEAT
jgi:hypothetical protein